MKRNKAFTLIELMIVISVISLLATVVMYSTSEARLKADDAHMKTESRQVATAIQLYKDDHGGQAPVSASYRTTIEEEGSVMVAENDPVEGKKVAYTESMQKLVTGGYLPEIPTSPDGSSYSYLVTTDEKDAVFVASLKVSSSGSNSSSNNSNSCDIVGPSQDYLDYLTCLEWEPACDDAYICPVEECTIGKNGEDICEIIDYGPVFCDGDRETCDAENVDCEFTPNFLCSREEPPVCEEPEDTPVCSGSSDYDYCSCI